MDKKILRHKMLNLRNQLSAKECEKRSEQIAEHLLNTDAYQRAEYLLVYMHYQKEVMTNQIITHALNVGKHVFVPRVSGKDMEFYEIHSFKDCSCGFHGILEPSKTCGSLPEVFCNMLSSPSKQNTLMILPGLAFDATGHRLGYGGGYYDRYLSQTGIECEKMAVAFSFQIIEHVPYEEHDILIDCVITD
ncbi:MAG: 5-formyltetrahydrofolate cyclo-ligase [Lachnospiraceae bacterium]|nr:5-formyltetrahydrofolate cyclo-ligase [Lachnospiraceae bacterium]